MAAGLEDCLQSVHSLLRDKSSAGREQIEIIVDDIKQICEQEISEKETDYSCSLLFDRETGIISFLQKTADSEEFQNGKASALTLLSELIQKMGKKILPYAVDIKEVCVSVYSRDRFAKVKNAAIPVLVKLLELTAGSTMGEDLQVENMIKKFFNELTKASKLSATVKASIYHLLGVIAEMYPDIMTPYSERLVTLFVNALKAEMTAKTKKPELAIIAGCLDGLTAFMLNFTQSAEDGSKHSYEIFKYARKAVDSNIEYTKYDVPRAGLRLFARHAGQFRQYLMDEHKAMYKTLQDWSHHNNRDVLHLGVFALEAFMKEICEELVERAKAGQKEGAVFKFFLLEFRRIMNSKTSTSKEVSMAIRSYGLLAAPCRTFLTEEDVQFMLGEMINKCEHQFFGQTEEIDEKLITIPSYLTSLANIIGQVDSVSTPYALVLERLMVMLIENIPQVNKPQQYPCIKSILQLLLTLMGKATVFHQVLSSTVYQGLIRSCSHPIVAETAEVEETDLDMKTKKFTYKDYLTLWCGLLESTRMKELAADDFTIADRNQLTKAIYNELMRAILKILDKLDFEATVSDEALESGAENAEDKELLSADPTFGKIAKKPRDFQVFINVVDFCKDLLVNHEWCLFSNWIFKFTHSLIILSTRYPLVSGFYKLLSVTMTVANKLNYFKDLHDDNSHRSSADESMDVDIPDTEDNVKEKQATYQLIKKFSKEVLVRMKQYRDEILASCLTLILSLPKEIIAEQMPDIIPAIQTTFTIGLSYLPLANIGLDALEYWCQHLPASVLEPYYAEILPCLDAYLRTDERGGDEMNADPTVMVKSKKSSRKVQVPVRLVREKKTGADEKSSISQLSAVRHRILRYLGLLGGQVNHALLANSDEEISKEAIAWDTQKHLRFDVPFFDMKPAIYFDPFLPRVVKLAQQSSDRQTKVAACELLHSLVLFALGRGAQMPGETQKKYPMEQLYRKLFPPLLSLACDVEQVCKDLFEPLMMQLIHWFTNNKMAESPETMALLDSIFDGLIQPSDTALRDFSARCLREFLQWSLKQISKKAAEKNPINAKSVIKRMHSYALHPGAFKRMGAALAFNNIYMVFREEDALVDRFTFEILVHFVESLALAHADDKSLGTQEQCVKALEHLERIIVKKVEMLKKDPGTKTRPEPSFWTSRNLPCAVRWLTRQCGIPQTECRHASMKLVFNLCTLLPGIKSPKDFFAIFHKSDGASYFLKRFEGGGHAASENHGLLAYPTIDKIDNTFTLSAAAQWFDMLLAALDCYCWIFGEDLMSPSQIFTGKGSEMSCIFKTVVFFLEKLAFSDISGAADLFLRKDSVIFTPREREEYNRMKCTVIIRMWNFLSILLAKHTAEVAKVVPPGVWCENLWRLLCDCIVRPTDVGFNMADTEIMLQLPKEMNQVLAVMTKCLPAAQQKQLKSTIAHQLEYQCNITELLPISLTSASTDYTSLAQTVEGYRQLHAANLLVENLPKSVVKDKSSLAEKLFDNVFKGIVERDDGTVTQVNLTPTAFDLAKSLLTLSLELGISAEALVKKILDKSTVQGYQRGAEVGHGDLFFTLFSQTVVAHIVRSGRDVLKVLMGKAKMECKCVGNVLVALLDYVAKDRALRKREGVNICGDILSHWAELRPWWGDEATPETQSLALLVLTKIVLIDSKCTSDPSSKTFIPVFEMYQNMLKDSRTSMGFKNQTLDLLPFFATLKDQHEGNLKDTLNRFIADNFPLKSSEFSPGTHQYKDYITAIDKLLVAMEMTGSLMLLEVMLSVLCRERQHSHEDAIQSGLARFMQRLPMDKQTPAIDVPYAIFAKEDGFPAEIRRAAVERVCLPLLRLASTASVIEFFSKHIHELINHLDVRLNKATEAILENQLITKLCCFQLLELMYARLSKDEVNAKSSVINQKFCHGHADTGKEMTQKITKAAQEAKSEDTRGEEMLPDLRRQYHCYAYNLMIAIISCVQSEMKFFKGFLFQDNVAKGQFLLDNFIDTNVTYEFQVELESPMERRKKFVSIRNEAREKRATEAGEDFKDTSVTPSLHLASQYLADSSLSDDLNLYDFNMSSSGQSGSYKRGMKDSRSHSSLEESQSMEVSASEDYVELEMDALNQHECMAPMIALIKHMAAAKISPEVPKGTIPKEMPPWMSYLHEKMTSLSTHINIKLFIAKLLMNCAQTVQPYAKFWLKPLCQLLFTQEVSGGGITYFAVDLIVTMVTWHTTAIPEDTLEERAMASRVVKLLVSNIYHPTRQVFRNNLELLKTLLECWRDRVEIPYDDVYGLFKVSDPKSAKAAAGVQVLGVVLDAKFQPYGPSAPVSKERYLNSMSMLMNHHLKTVYAAAAEVVGLILYRLADGNKETEGTFHEQVVTQLISLAHAKADNFIICVHSIHKSYPPITERFLNKLLFMLPSLHGQFRAQCLEVILGHLDKMENPFLEINSKGLPQFLAHRDEDSQLVSLKIVRAIMQKLKGSELLSLLPAVTAFSSHSSPACRKIMLDILMWVYDNYRESDDPDSDEIMKRTKEALLRGLCDENEPCRVLCQNFWSSNTRLPEGTLDRTVSMLEAMYSPSTEPHYLSYATNLLLEATSKSPDYQREIFEHPLSDCKFEDFSVRSSWRQRHAVMTPLFAATVMSQSMDVSGEGDTLDGGLRATQDVAQFTATMDVGGSGKAFNWLTQSSLDTFTETGTIGGDSQLLFRVDERQGSSRSKGRGQALAAVKGRPSQVKRTAVLRTAGSGDNAPSTSTDVTDGPAESLTDVWRLKRRFIRDQQSQSVYFMRRNIRLRKMREEAVKEQQARRENAVTLYRKYRKGDLPDIQIKYQYIIAPLQALAQKDSSIARLLFSSMFEAIFREMDKVKTEREMEELIQLINKSVENILSESRPYFFPPFTGCILNILYELRSSLKVPASDLGISAIVSNQQTLGIMVLEEQLIQCDPRNTASATGKKARKTREPEAADTAMWIELSRLYKSVRDFDMIQGIFSDKLGTKDLTREAVDAEARGDYKLARQLYEKAMSCQNWEDGKDPLDAEIDFWDASRMECLDNLGQWRDLEEVSVKGVDSSDTPNLDRVWDGTFYQEQYLPYVIRSKLKLLLSGDNQQPLLTFVDHAMTDEGKKQHLQSRYCAELALMYLWQEDYDRSRHFTSLAFESFLQDWSGTSTLMESTRRAHLHKIQALMELQEFLDYVGMDRHYTSTKVSRLMKLWEGRSPHRLLDPVTVWDDVVTNRSVYLDQILAHSEGGGDASQSQDSVVTEGSGTGQRMEEMKAWLRLAMADSCREQNNFKFTLKLLKETHSACKQLANQQPLVEWVHLYAKTHHSKSSKTVLTLSECNETFTNICTTLDQLGKLSDKPVLTERPDLGLRHQVLKGHSFDILAEGLINLGDETPEFKDETLSKLLKHAGILEVPKGIDESQLMNQLINQLITRGFESLKAAVSQDDDRRPNGGPCVMTSDEANLELAKFCNKYLQLKEDKEDEKLDANCELPGFAKTAVVCLLQAMKGGLSEARQRFPRLLQIAEFHKDVIDVFIKKAAEIPSWMFILWVSQMTALLDKAESVVVAPILTWIATEYPQSLIYAFRMSSEDFKFGTSAQDKKNKETVERLAQLVNNPLVNKFICALEQFGQPDMIFKDWCGDVKKLLPKKGKSKEELKKKYKELCDELLNVKAADAAQMSGTLTSASSTAGTVEVGEIRKNVANGVRADFEKIFGKDGEKLATMSDKEFRSVEGKLLQKLSELLKPKGRDKLPSKLKDYSPWLAEFNPNRHGKDLEIPGQYDGDRKPMPEYHVKVAGFDERVLILQSLRKPKRITIRGNDEKEYPYLVKSGEDLRMDQRIETLFYIMNKVMNSDPACRQRKLHLKTYQVISMTPRVGLIEWMKATTPLKNFLYDALTDEEKKYMEGPQGPARQHQTWLQKVGKGLNGPKEIYACMYKKCTRTETEQEFRQKEGKVPWDLSRRAVHQMSSSPEAFHVLRSTMASSHAVICICQYLLGIGDRHLSNFMVNLSTGHMVGIDFGHAFGSATQFLPVPELVPFRLTRQLVNLNMPLKAKGQMENTMRHVLRALRNDSDLLLSTMDVFVKEPSLDWMNFADRQTAVGMQTEDARTDDKWYPKQKVEFARRKLKGDHPGYIMKDELKLGKHAAFNDINRVLMGDQKEDVRAGLQKTHNLAVEEQVAALIDQATDPNILGRFWVGWEPWV